MLDGDLVYKLLIFIPVLLVAISVHESMHALASYMLGDDSAKEGGRISLNPLRHIDPLLTVALPIVLLLAGLPPFGAAKPVYVDMTRVKFEEFGGAIIAVVGPLSNLVMAIIAAVLLSSFESLQSGIAADILYISILFNIGFFVFNSIPWPPLDGSRVLYAFAPRPLQNFMDMIEQQGIFGLIIFMLLLFPFIQPLISGLVSSITSGLL